MNLLIKLRIALAVSIVFVVALIYTNEQVNENTKSVALSSDVSFSSNGIKQLINN